MLLCVCKNKIGTDSHLIYDGSSFSWVSRVPNNCWTYGSKCERDISEPAKSLGIDFFSFESTKYAKAMRHIIGFDSDILWSKSIPADVFKKHMRDLVEQLWRFTIENHDGYHMQRIKMNRKTLRQLERSHVHIEKIKTISSEDKTNKSKEVERFLPSDKTSLAPPSVYSLIKTITGRLVVESGPNILTLKKSSRKILKSRFKNGFIVQADISTLEPRIALALAGKEYIEDVKRDLQNEKRELKKDYDG